MRARKRVELAQVGAADRARIDEQAPLVLQRLEQRSGPRTGSVQLVAVEQRGTRRRRGAARAAGAGARAASRRGVEQIGDEHDQRAPPPRQLGDALERAPPATSSPLPPSATTLLERRQQVAEVVRARARRHGSSTPRSPNATSPTCPAAGSGGRRAPRAQHARVLELRRRRRRDSAIDADASSRR